MAEKKEIEYTQNEKEIAAILYGLRIIQEATGHGTLQIVIKDGTIAEIHAKHVIRPKYLNPSE